MSELPSKLLSRAVEALSGLPTIGKKSALRLAIHLIQTDPAFAKELVQSIAALVEGIRRCERCNNLSDEQCCDLCLDPRRNASIICVVESFRDVLAIEETGRYKGLYHVLGGLISPLDGIGPEDLGLEKLFDRIAEGKTQEVILALNPTMDGEMTNFYLHKKLKKYSIQISTLARGVSFGGELQYADELTLGHSIMARLPYEVT